MTGMCPWGDPWQTPGAGAGGGRPAPSAYHPGMSDVLDLAERFIHAVAAGDLDTVRSIYAPDAVIWHNNDRRETTVEENLRVLGWMAKHVSDKAYTDIRRQETDNGYVQQHVLRGTAPNGQSFEVAACLIVDVDAGRITRLDEYLDTAAIQPLLG